ncbi:hypothetical protein JCM33374_g4669 [Metschnikowia sp. JCM 33374]|nr:hypothetical protein JCM33374_g4669 [Metschnikowia sp. JCM 33374]
MDYLRGPSLHPPWIFPWWGQKNDTSPSKVLEQKSKRERFRQMFSIRFKFKNEIFHRRSSRLFHKAYVGECLSKYVDGANTEGGATAEANAKAPSVVISNTTESGGYKVVGHLPNQESIQEMEVNAPHTRPRTASSVSGHSTQEERLSVRSAGATSENHSLLRKIRLRWLQSPNFGSLSYSQNGTRKSVPQPISFLKEMCPGPSTTEVSHPIR